MSLWVPVLLFIVGFLALFLELFVPAAGMIGAVGIGCMITGTVFGYRFFGNVVGSLFLTGTLIGTPAIIIVGLKVFPKTFVGKKLILRESQKRESGFTSYTSERYEGLARKEGTAVTTLRPSGMIVIGSRKYSVVTSGEMIAKGEQVKVIKVEGSRIVVRKIHEKGGQRRQSSS